MYFNIIFCKNVCDIFHSVHIAFAFMPKIYVCTKMKERKIITQSTVSGILILWQTRLSKIEIDICVKTVNNRNKLSQKPKEFLKIVYSVFIMYSLHDFTSFDLRTLHFFFFYFFEIKMNTKVKMWMKKLFYVFMVVNNNTKIKISSHHGCCHTTNRFIRSTDIFSIDRIEFSAKLIIFSNFLQSFSANSTLAAENNRQF